MRLFFELVQRSFQRQMAYRAATLAGLVTNFFFGLLRVALMVALYGARPQMAGFSLAAAITFTGLSQALIGVQSLFGWYELMNSIYTGAVASDLLKPVGYFRFWLAQDLGRAVAQLLLRGLPMMAAYALLFGLTTPRSILQWLAFGASLALSWVMSFSYRYLINLAGFWTPNATGMVRLGFILLYFFSGFLMPLRFFPEWFNHLCAWLPYPYMVNTVLEMFLGVLSGPEIGLALLRQAIWAVILVLACDVALRAGVRRLVIQGG